MPNKRDDNKKQVAFWLSLQEREMLEKAAQIHGMNMTDLVKAAIAKMLMEDAPNASNGDDSSKGDSHAEGVRRNDGQSQG